MSSLRNKKTGFLGEEIATKHLQSYGMTIVERNFHKRYSEIDIIARDKSTLVFVEVKTRNTHDFGTPEDAFTPWKRRSLLRAVQYYLLLHPQSLLSLRIDMIAVNLDSNDKLQKLTWYKNVS